jgi:hypothetical protein
MRALEMDEAVLSPNPPIITRAEANMQSLGLLL